MPIEDKPLKVLPCLNPKKEEAYNSLQQCRVVPGERPSVQQEEEVTTGEEWIRYQKFKVTEDDMKLKNWQVMAYNIQQITTNGKMDYANQIKMIKDHLMQTKKCNNEEYVP